VLTEAQPRHPPQRNLELLDRIASRIRPDDPALLDWFAKYGREHRTRLATDLQIVEAHLPRGAHLLEYGAIPLLMTAALAETGYDVKALDVAPQRFAGSIEQLGLDVRRCDVETEAVPHAAETFDAVLFNELFEHLRINPIFTLREVHRVLRPEGLLLLSTPNLRSFRGLKNLILRNEGHAATGDVYRQYEKLEALGHMGHVREYTTKEVADFIARIGFRVDKVVFRGGFGKGLVGLAEQLAPALRPFFTIVATRLPAPGTESGKP
jgi:SAM-dependent methyltransferase